MVSEYTDRTVLKPIRKIGVNCGHWTLFETLITDEIERLEFMLKDYRDIGYLTDSDELVLTPKRTPAGEYARLSDLEDIDEVKSMIKTRRKLQAAYDEAAKYCLFY